MAYGVRRGEIWLYDFKPPDKRRPVVVLTQQDVIPILPSVMVAPVTSTIRGAPVEVLVGVDEGLKHDSAINLDYIQTVETARLFRFVGSLSQDKLRQVFQALAVATGCAS